MSDVAANKSAGNAATHEGETNPTSSLTWPSFYPDHCPPAGATPAEGVVLRLVRNDPPSADDFLPWSVENGRVDKSKPCQSCAVSVYEKLDDIQKMQRRVPAQRPKSVAEGELKSEMGVTKLTWKYALKADTVQVLPYEDAEKEYLEVAVVEAMLSSRKRSSRIAEMIQRAIPYPVLLVMFEGSGACASVAHKRFSLAEKGSIVAEDFLSSPWNGETPKDIDEAFCDALSLRNLSQVDFYALYRSLVQAVLARACADLTGRFVLDGGGSEADRRRRLDQCHEMEREIGSLRVAIGKQDRFAEQVELNTQLKELENRLDRTKAEL